MYMRVAHYEIKRQADGGRLAVYTVEVARRRGRVALTAPAAGRPAAQRRRPNPNTRRRRGFGAV